MHILIAMEVPFNGKDDAVMRNYMINKPLDLVSDRLFDVVSDEAKALL